jgi:hypothetical protein
MMRCDDAAATLVAWQASICAATLGLEASATPIALHALSRSVRL